MELIDVKDRFLKDQIKQAELEVFLSAQDSSQTEPNIVLYGADINYIDVVRVQYSKSGKMASIQCWQNSADRLTRKVENAIYADHGKRIGSRVVFTNTPVTGVFRHGDKFQLIPVPPESVKGNWDIGEHPAILEYSYHYSNDCHVDSHRYSARADEVAKIVSSMVFGGIRWHNNHLKRHWVYHKDDSGNLTSQHVQEGYLQTSWSEKDQIGFSIVHGHDELALVDQNEYFLRKGIVLGSKFDLPNGIQYLFEMYEALDFDEKAKALLSAHWLQLASSIHHYSGSLSLSATVNSLESLLPPPNRIGNCSECDQGIFETSVSAAFKDLVKKYAVGVDPKYIGDIYSLRSKISHGSGLFAPDQMVGHQFSDPMMKAEQLHRLAGKIAQVVFINWLASRTQHSV
jgi:hypothetical protein